MNWKKDNTPTAEDWILQEAESFQEKLELANKTILIFQSLNWFQKAFKSKKLFKAYFRELHRLDTIHKTKRQELEGELKIQTQSIVKEHKGHKKKG